MLTKILLKRTNKTPAQLSSNKPDYGEAVYLNANDEKGIVVGDGSTTIPNLKVARFINQSIAKKGVYYSKASSETEYGLTDENATDIYLKASSVKVTNGNTVQTSITNIESSMDGKSTMSQVVSTLTVAGWSNNSQTIVVNGISSDTIIWVAPAPASVDAYGEAGIVCESQGTNSLTFSCKEAPTEAITVNLVISNTGVIDPVVPGGTEYIYYANMVSPIDEGLDPSEFYGKIVVDGTDRLWVSTSDDPNTAQWRLASGGGGSSEVFQIDTTITESGSPNTTTHPVTSTYLIADGYNRLWYSNGTAWKTVRGTWGAN